MLSFNMSKNIIKRNRNKSNDVTLATPKFKPAKVEKKIEVSENRTPSMALASADNFMRALHTSNCPFWAAMCKGVFLA